VTLEVLAEFGRSDLPVLANASFGHNVPSGVIPMGAMAEIDCEKGKFTILENVTL
jgi:muramoyltetrapeptide carboxypeptidase LdcA involved in peptidoglycan recycling